MSNEQEMIDALAQEIRRVDGNHDLGAGQLAEALFPFIKAATLAAEARIRELEADAKRYRFIRKDEIQPKDGVPFICVYQGSFVQLTLGVADEQIDAALTEHKENQDGN